MVLPWATNSTKTSWTKTRQMGALLPHHKRNSITKHDFLNKLTTSNLAYEYWVLLPASHNTRMTYGFVSYGFSLKTTRTRTHTLLIRNTRAGVRCSYPHDHQTPQGNLGYPHLLPVYFCYGNLVFPGVVTFFSIRTMITQVFYGITLSESGQNSDHRKKGQL